MIKEVLERFFRWQLVEGIVNDRLFTDALNLYTFERFAEDLDCFEALAKESEMRIA